MHNVITVEIDPKLYICRFDPLRMRNAIINEIVYNTTLEVECVSVTEEENSIIVSVTLPDAADALIWGLKNKTPASLIRDIVNRIKL